VSRAAVGPAESGLRPLGSAFAALGVPGFCLIVLGALVRAHEAGLACPDWPLCFGLLVPEMNLRVGFEWSHRVLAGAISLGFLGLSIRALRRPDTPAGAQRLIWITGLLLGIQILLGVLEGATGNFTEGNHRRQFGQQGKQLGSGSFTLGEL